MIYLNYWSVNYKNKKFNYNAIYLKKRNIIKYSLKNSNQTNLNY